MFSSYVVPITYLMALKACVRSFSPSEQAVSLILNNFQMSHPVVLHNISQFFQSNTSYRAASKCMW
jgi:hypothetical protein